MMQIFGRTPVAVRGTLILDLDDGSTVEVELASLEIPSDLSDEHSRLALGLDYSEMGPIEDLGDHHFRVSRGAPYLTADIRLRATDPRTDSLVRLTHRRKEA